MNKVGYIVVVHLIDRWSDQLARAGDEDWLGGVVASANHRKNRTIHSRWCADTAEHNECDRQHPTAAYQLYAATTTTTDTAYRS